MAVERTVGGQIAEPVLATRRPIETHLTDANLELDIGGRDELEGTLVGGP